jgi:hypothetical protein
MPSECVCRFLIFNFLFFANEIFLSGNSPDLVEGSLINYRKRELVYESIEHIQRFQGNIVCVYMLSDNIFICSS